MWEGAKTYDVGFRVRDPVTGRVEISVPSIRAIYNCLASPPTADLISDLAGDNVRRRCYWLLCNQAFWGSGLVPHRDSPARDHTGADRRINVIYFVDANGKGWEAGGTSILKSNDFSEPIFVPNILTNSMLIYRTGDSFFHGFPPMKFGKYRRVITAHYCPID